MQVEWEKCSLLELDITATDLSTECLIDMLTRIPALRYIFELARNNICKMKTI